MARPKKHNVDYFSHDVQMRNDLKIKALRRKFGHSGYSFYNMMLEQLGNCEYFEYEWNERNKELLSADFDIDAEEINTMVEFCLRLELLQIYNNYLTCDKLTKRLEDTVLVKRKDYCRNNSMRVKLKGVNTEITNVERINDGINAQSKVKESKANKSKEESKEKESKEESKEKQRIEKEEIKVKRISELLYKLKQNKVKGNTINFESFNKEFELFNLPASELFELYNEY
jgi:hypothetical protein